MKRRDPGAGHDYYTREQGCYGQWWRRAMSKARRRRVRREIERQISESETPDPDQPGRCKKDKP